MGITNTFRGSQFGHTHPHTCIYMSTYQFRAKVMKGHNKTQWKAKTFTDTEALRNT